MRLVPGQIRPAKAGAAKYWEKRKRSTRNEAEKAGVPSSSEVSAEEKERLPQEREAGRTFGSAAIARRER
ncbi:hypothetical protein NDU88_003476 [Pleurodeles waltl]|uniref:Uncharacterized protein n=1 Tax=Pleurodeles waltl TaxID=8319 RepID=A0AAV7VH77_PLEWA|nr:hypothetical protein NDU88_003476 [Pleurodeles waltl]